jgi:hypothetical protein
VIDEAARHLHEEERDRGEKAEDSADEKFFQHESDPNKIVGDVAVDGEEIFRKKDEDKCGAEHHPNDHGKIFTSEEGSENHDRKNASDR